MPILNLKQPTFISVTGAGRPNSGGTVGAYVADGTYTTLATIYSDQIKTTELSNPVTLDDAGTKEIWYDVKVDIREKTSAGVLIRDTENLDPNASQASVQGFNLAQNGSFEIDSTSDGQPDNWTISPYSGSAIAITNDVVTDGVEALEFNATGAGSGGGTATSAKFPVTEGSVCSVAYSILVSGASAETTTNTFTIKWYTEADVYVSSSAVTVTHAAIDTWYNLQQEVTVAATATQGEIVLVGIASGGVAKSSKAYFDGISIFNNVGIVTLTGSQILTNKTLTSPVLNTTVSGTAVLDEDTMTTDSDTQIATQQSIKAYVDAVETKIASLNTKVIDIGNWDMDTTTGDGTAAVAVTHGLTLSKIRAVVVSIRSDDTLGVYNFDVQTTSDTSTRQIDTDGTDVNLTRSTGGFFDSTAFDTDTAFNRGWITIQYTD